MRKQHKYYGTMLGGTLLAAIIFLSGVAANAQTHSDFNKKFTFAQLNTWNFANEKVNTRDKLGPNEIWDNYLREDLTAELVKLGFDHSHDRPDLIVRYRLGTKQKEHVNIINDNWPGYMYNRGRWVYWRGGWGRKTIFRTPYDESTLVVDVVDTRSGELVWRGFDRRAIDGKSEKALKRSVEKLMGKFAKDVRNSRKVKG